MEVVKLRPYIKEIVWGGNTLRDYGKVSDTKNIAECWELSLHEEGSSIIDSGVDKGKLLADVLTKEDCGEKCEKFPFFPTLIKLIDAKRELSVQVHPSDEYALKNENSFGKTEMWYILEADKGSGIYLGFEKDTNEKEVRQKIKDNTLIDLLNFIEVKPGDCYFVKSGTVHAIGGGITLFEVQQNSALTYRLYDWGKLGMDGKPRELHVNKALKVMNLKKYEPTNFKRPLLGECAYFSTSERLVSEKSKIEANNGAFISLTFIEGSGKLNDITYKKGDTFFIPSGKTAEIKGTGKYLETTIK